MTPIEYQKIFQEEVWVPFVQDLKVSKKIKKYLLKYGCLPVVNGVVQGWVVFEMVSTGGIPIDVIEEIVQEKQLTLDLDDFERRMSEFKVISRANQKSGLQRV